jgi:hypothetical protein
MQDLQLRTEVTGNNNNYTDNDDTRAIDAQLVVAPQYGIVGRPPKFDPPNQPNTTPPKGKGPKTKPAQYVVRQERTRDLKLHMAILRAELALVVSGKLRVSDSVREAMKARITLMSEEKARRDLRDLAGGKQRSDQSFHSLGARARVA